MVTIQRKARLGKKEDTKRKYISVLSSRRRCRGVGE